MSTLWLNRIIFIALAWLVVACVAALILGQLVNYGKRQEAKARQRVALCRSQQQTVSERSSIRAATAMPDIQEMAEKHDAGT